METGASPGVLLPTATAGEYDGSGCRRLIGDDGGPNSGDGAMLVVAFVRCFFHQVYQVSFGLVFHVVFYPLFERMEVYWW